MKIERCQLHKPSRRGYALLITLVMLGLLGVILGGMARRSADTALQARDAEQAMRQRWAEASCSDTLLASASERADDRLTLWQTSQDDDTAIVPTGGLPIAYEVIEFSLAGLKVWARIDDEQAKINLNERLRSSPDAAVMPSAVVDAVLSPSRSASIKLTRQPFIETLGLQPLMSWQQVLPGNDPKQLLGIERPEALTASLGSQAVVNRVTLWGEGTINFWTADDQVVRKRLQGTVQPITIENLLRLRAEEPQLPLGTLYENATEDRDERAALERTFVEHSACHSMWLAIVPSGRQDVPPKWSLKVFEKGGDQESGQRSEYRW